MKKLMVILITGLLYMSCTDSMEVSEMQIEIIQRMYR